MTDMDTAKFRLDLRDERLLRDGLPVQITNKTFRLLRFFLQNPNRLLTKDEILDNVWPGVYVSEGLIKEYVHDLRLALGDDPKKPTYIETVRGRGYRFLGGVEVVNRAENTAAMPGPRTGPPSVAVLPFQNLAEGERWARFCHGVCDDLITDLSRFPDLLVIAKSSSFAYERHQTDIRTIGQHLGARYVLEGSMQASETKLRMNVQLIETQHGHHVWANRYERDIGDLFAIQSDIVGQVASALAGLEGQIPHAERLRLGREPPHDLEAYDLYLLGYELEERFEKRSALQAFELLQRAVALDPHFARAWLILAWTCFQIVSEGWDKDAQKYASIEREAYIKAATLDPGDPIAIMELAAQRAIDGDLVSAVGGFERALGLGSNQADLLSLVGKYVAMVMDDPPRALQIMDRSLELNPQAPEWYYMNLARVAYFAKDFKHAISAAKRAPDVKYVRLFELLSVAQLGRVDELRELSGAFKERYPEFDLKDFMRDPPIIGPCAKALFLDGIEKAGFT